MQRAGMGHSAAGMAAGAWQEAGRAVGEAKPWMERAARLGYAAKGVVYLIVGILAARAALGAGGAVGDSRDALGIILEQPLGRALLGVVAVGLLGYALWRLVTAVVDTEGKGRDAKGIATRIAVGISGAIHVALGVEAARLAAGSGGGGGGEGTQHWAARALELPAGRWLLGLAGLAVVGYALAQLAVAASPHKVRRHLDLSALDEASARWVVRAGRFGVAARALVFGVVGWLAVRAALHERAQEAGGTAEALRTMQAGDAGPWLLGFVGLGLVAYAIYQFLNARYRVLRV